MIYAGILAGGKGTRMGKQELPKQFLELGDKPIIIHTLEKFLLVPEFNKIVVGVHPDWVTYTEDLIKKYLYSYTDRIELTPGGTDRNSTIKNIIKYINEKFPGSENGLLVTHDSVRPFVSLKMIKENILLADKYDAADTVVEATDTIVQSINHETISEIPDRQYLYQGQTPQTFKMNAFLELYDSLDENQKQILTDACKIFVVNNKKVALVKGEYSNIKITTVTDLKIARSMIGDM
ncbi:2-C-methyl-D-erythritol 4-phosphate cytidylyltransferase [Enterococcus cecorum]|uniref:Ribitol-5-phosphate cytidylyltransferase n=1 Tax=Enterococcus cecorum TaxID=44008 RepID=A0A1Y4R0A3_9ENTE|nr:2-C-methyl-D-erythritol 4-phosphate cytidylyltransferase [Enterococcus cecorum]OUQ09943.1 2-C-methyl-D-erythritol 4-phosphate cytidylyltransferase [Enterococcus cecorum]RBR37187.1 2-C-methyl-D-erythritol 4-phosphate cytidylyltransferase [Enterococcus cecorum]